MILSDKQITTVIDRVSFYRQNPQRFCSDYMIPNIHLKMFQIIIIYMMNISTNFMYLAARGQGKTFIVAVFCCIRCILYPGTKIVVASGRRSQAMEVLEKIINELCQQSINLKSEIDMKSTTLNQANAVVQFKNGSYIKVVTASDSSRGNRANILIIDEFRLVSVDVINRVLKKFKGSSRHPGYLDKPEYADCVAERNKEVYLSSTWFKQHWSYDKFKSYCVNMMDENKKYFVCGLPYQLSVREGLLDAGQVQDEMDETDFDEISWMMEMEALWYGESEKSFFSYDDLIRSRKVMKPLYRYDVYSQIPEGSGIKYIPKKPNEIRLLCYDVAVMPGKANDSSSCYLLQLNPTQNGTQYHRRIVLAHSSEGERVDVQALYIRRAYEELECNYIVLDTNGAGIGVYDLLTCDMTDPETGEVYPALGCCNNEEMHARSTNTDADKVIYSVKASASFNNDCAVKLRDAVKRGKITMPVDENTIQGELERHKWYNSLSQKVKSQILYPYIQATLLIYELVNLECDTKNGAIKIYEKSGARKDKYSALSYGNYVASMLERDLKSPSRGSGGVEISDLFQFRAPKIKR